MGMKIIAKLGLKCRRFGGDFTPVIAVLDTAIHLPIAAIRNHGIN